MHEAQGHIAKRGLAPEGALQTVGSADFFGLEYEPFGSLLPGRNYSSDSYRFGFQGQEKDDEVFGSTGTAISFEYRMHDPRVGRFLSIDPLAAQYPYMTPYQFAGNKPIWSREIEGLESEVDRMDASFNRYPQGQKGQDWDYIEGNTYLRQQNSRGTMPGNFFYSTQLGRQNGVGTSYYRQITMNNVATNSTQNATQTQTANQSSATVDGGGLGFVNWTATPTSPAAANATMANAAAAAPNGTTTVAGAPVTTSTSNSTQTRTPQVVTTTTVTTAVTVQTNVQITNQSSIQLNYATTGAFTPVGGGRGGIGSQGLLNARFGFVRSGLVGLGVPADQISLGSSTWNAPASMTGGALNRFSFGITINTNTLSTTTTTNTITTNTSLRFTGYTD